VAQSSDAVIKREIIDTVGHVHPKINLRIFPESSKQDQLPFSQGGLTFGYNHTYYGSCDACWYVNENWINGYDGKLINIKPIIALEGTDALNRGSTGNAQTQRFHHVLGAVKAGIIGIYYLRPGRARIRPDLFGMAYFASRVEKGKYLIIDNLKVVSDILGLYESSVKCEKYVDDYLDSM